jgi:hypothetical protein
VWGHHKIERKKTTLATNQPTNQESDSPKMSNEEVFIMMMHGVLPLKCFQESRQQF